MKNNGTLYTMTCNQSYHTGIAKGNEKYDNITPNQK